jgi:hypothetical protein
LSASSAAMATGGYSNRTWTCATSWYASAHRKIA